MIEYAALLVDIRRFLLGWAWVLAGLTFLGPTLLQIEHREYATDLVVEDRQMVYGTLEVLR